MLFRLHQRIDLPVVYQILVLVAGMASLATAQTPASFRVPLGGNSWIRTATGKAATLTKDGLSDWTNPANSIDTYVRFEKAGMVRLSTYLRVPTGKSRLRVSLMGQSKEVDVQGADLAEHELGIWPVTKPGYVTISLQGISKTGKTFADVTDVGISGEPVDEQTSFVRTNDGNFFHWGRRGPSVHLRYPLPADTEAEWFYNEVTVPTGNDVIGSYYMANGFGEGYFGMQVNSPTERRILFSVWSPFQTDDPKSIPDDQKIRLARKGTGVITNDFGKEGAGGQSFLRYNWQAGQTYKFLLHAQPGPDSYTTYTAYFGAPDSANWRLIASFKRPKTTTYLKSLYSFLENFTPETGNQQREAYFGNQWIRRKEGQWQELTTCQFTGDNTARKSFRKDYAGGLQNGRFVLRNCGFFDDYTPLGSPFTRPATNQAPTIDLDRLP
ncbi:DUF3472 domain-containing protein [Fibrella forsythiae]|uniref:DUF3472 domain-containing protein n=1 Tax=Fibrella forsythiae TaxID=2817061 RepID=A0ABS3JDH4_9BACT|nr:DUF3472 domain-containing protein [Fibrella forsythiae]MBO0948049.1 DUF3472 domain-containing protein [Fibrella forsythiae]